MDGCWRGFIVGWVYACAAIGFYSGADFVRRPQVEVLQSSNKPPRNARKPDWTRNELIRLSALMSGQSRRLLGERLIGYMPSGLGCRGVRVLPVSSLNLMPCKCSD